jgi:hypothetical protein
MRSRCMSLLPRTTLHSDSEHKISVLILAHSAEINASLNLAVSAFLKFSVLLNLVVFML